MKSQDEILHSPFDMKTHKENFINYLEVIILENGTIEYAIPSHIKKLEEICCKKLGIKYDSEYYENKELLEYYKSIYKNNLSYWNDMLFEISKAICVWNDRYSGIANENQIKKLKELKDYGLYYGEVLKNA